MNGAGIAAIVISVLVALILLGIAIVYPKEPDKEAYYPNNSNTKNNKPNTDNTDVKEPNLNETLNTEQEVKQLEMKGPETEIELKKEESEVEPDLTNSYLLEEIKILKQQNKQLEEENKQLEPLKKLKDLIKEELKEEIKEEQIEELKRLNDLMEEQFKKEDERNKQLDEEAKRAQKQDNAYKSALLMNLMLSNWR